MGCAVYYHNVLRRPEFSVHLGIPIIWGGRMFQLSLSLESGQCTWRAQVAEPRAVRGNISLSSLRIGILGILEKDIQLYFRVQLYL